MRKMGRKMLAFVLAGVLVCLLVSCGKEESSPAYTVGGNTTTGESTASGAAGSEQSNAGGNTTGSSQSGENQTTEAPKRVGEVLELTTLEAAKSDKVYIGKEFDIMASESDSTAFLTMRLNAVGDALCYSSQRTVVTYPFSDGKAQFHIKKWKGQADEWNLQQLAFDEEGNTYAIVTIKALPTSKSFVCKFDAEGENVYNYALADLLAETDSNSWSSAWDIEVDDVGNVYMSTDDRVWMFNSTGEYVGELKLGSGPAYSVEELRRGKDGTVYVLYSAEGAYSKVHIGEADFELKTVVNVNQGTDIKGVFDDGTGKLYAYDKGSLYQYDKVAGTMQPLNKWLESNINGNYLYFADKTADGKMVSVTFDYGADGGEIMLLEEMSETQARELGLLDERAVITIAIWGTGNKQELQAAIVEFNKINEKYKVITEDYTLGIMDGSVAVNRLSSEIMAGKGPDLIDEEFGILDDLAEKGGIENLYDYLAKSESLSKEDFFSNVLDAFTVNGVLTAIPYDMFIQTLIASSDIVGEEMGWTWDEMMDVKAKYPDVEFLGDGIGFMTKRFMFMDILQFYGDEFLDWDAGTCNFNTERFKELVEFASTYPDSFEPVPADSPSVYSLLESGELLVTEVMVSRLRDMQAYEEALQGKLTCIGYPTEEGVGCDVQTNAAYGISSASPNKEGAWEFLEFFLQFTNVSIPTQMSGIPANKTMLDELWKLDMMNDNPSAMRASDGWGYKYHTTTKEEMDRLYALIENIDFSTTNLDIITIICEEVGSYYSGQKPLDVVIEIMENRVENYMAENQ